MFPGSDVDCTGIRPEEIRILVPQVPPVPLEQVRTTKFVGQSVYCGMAPEPVLNVREKTDEANPFWQLP